MKASRAQLEAAENLAAMKAMRAYIDTLEEELRKLEQATIMDALGNTGHAHYALVVGTQKGIIKFEITFDHTAAAQSVTLTALARLKGDGPW